MKIVSFLKRHWYSALVFLILAVSIFLRFYNYSSRWGLAHDQAHDALIAREAIKQRKIPLLGPFASGANFVGGPQWYWLITLLTVLYPRSIFSPWAGLTLLYVFFVFLIIKTAEELGNKELGLTAGVITAFSSLQISQGVNLTNQSPMALVAAFSIWAMIKYLKTKKPLFAFFLGTGVALGINVHLQGIGLLLLIPVVSILGWRHSFKAVFWFLFGFFIQFVPLIIFDLLNNFYNLHGLLDYLRYGQYEIKLSSRWLTYIFSFWLGLWTKITGGYQWLSYIQGMGIGLLIIWGLWKKKLSRPILALILSFILIFISLRYYRGERFESYFVFTHPFVLLLSSWFIWKIWQWKKIAGGLILLLILIGSVQLNLAHYRVEKNRMYPLVRNWERMLTARFPGEKFALYDYRFVTQGITVSLALVLEIDGLIDDHGVKIGIATDPRAVSKETFFDKDGYSLTDLSEIKREGDKWAFLNPSEIWRATEEWYHKKN